MDNFHMKRSGVLQPTPLLIEEPPSTDDEGGNDLRQFNPALLHGSSGNFSNTTPRSAPTTPQGQHLPISTPSTTTTNTPHGCLSETQLQAVNNNSSNSNNNSSILRSPSHTVFSKTDKANLKQLSTSTPTMTAQGQLTEPPSPKTPKTKIRTASKARQKKFIRHFPNVEEDEKVLNHYSCALIGDILLQGHLYITKNYFAFYSNVFGYVTKLLIPVLSVEDITKERTAKIIPNAVGIVTSEDKHVFGSLMSRDSTMTYMRTVWEKAKHEEAIPEPEIIEPEDSSESGESGRESPAIEPVPSDIEIPAASSPEINGNNINRIENLTNSKEDLQLERTGSSRLFGTVKDAITEFRKLPRHSLILVATTLLLILLFLSATILLYRINKIQNRFSLNLQDPSLLETSEDIYSDLFQWQTHLHSKSASAVNNLLDNNLNQISKLRQSLEALSSLLTSKTTSETESFTTSTPTTTTPEVSVTNNIDGTDTTS